MERGEKKVGRLLERRLLFSFLFTRCSTVMRSKISSKYQADNLIQRTRPSYILPFKGRSEIKAND